MLHGKTVIARMRNLSLITQVALAAMLMRIVLGILAILLAIINPEANVVALFDLPTLSIYFFAARVLGVGARISTAADPVYFVIGCAVWFIGGALLGLVLKVLIQKRLQARDDA